MWFPATSSILEGLPERTPARGPSRRMAKACRRAAPPRLYKPGSFAASRSTVSMLGGMLSKAAALAINAAAMGSCKWA